MRTMDEIGTEYTKTATTLGDVNYRITTMKEEVRKLERRMRALNVEAQGVKNAETNVAFDLDKKVAAAKLEQEAPVETRTA